MDAKNFGRKILISENVVLGLCAAIVAAFLLELAGIVYLMLVAGGVAGFLAKKGWKSFLAGFLGVMIAWSIYFILFAAQGPLAAFLDLIGNAIEMPGSILLIAAELIGGFLGGIGALVGAFLTQILLGERHGKENGPKKD
nr:hypothetical protein [Candidatus Sigynarchaeota archaeon]